MTGSDRWKAMRKLTDRIQMHAMINASQHDRSAFPMAACYWQLLSKMNRFDRTSGKYHPTVGD